MGMDKSARAALYLRISDDPTGEAAGVDRQRADCLDRAQTDRLEVVAEYVDNDRSAYSGKPRPAFESMLRDAALGGFDVVVVWASDRLYRRVSDLTRITDELAPYARIAAVMGGGDIDLTTAEGILRAQVLGSVAEFESRRKAERVHARAVQRTKGERRMVASVRPIGWAWKDPCPGGLHCRHSKACAVPGLRPVQGMRTGLEVQPDEGPLLARAYQLVADGGSVRAATRLFTDSGLSTRRGGKWTPETIRHALQNARNAGLVAHRGEVVAEAADGQRIVPVELWQRVQSILDDPDRRTSPGRPAHTIMSGIAVCGRCGGPMNASNKHDGRGTTRKRPVYICAREQHLSRSRHLVDDYVVPLVRDWLVREKDTALQLARPGVGPAQTQAAAEVADLKDRLNSLGELVAGGQLDPDDYASATAASGRGWFTRSVVQPCPPGKPAVATVLTAPDPSAAFDELVANDLETLRAVLREVLDAVVVVPGRRGTDGLEIQWSQWATIDRSGSTIPDRR